MLLDKVRATRELIEKVKVAEERANLHQEYKDFYLKLNDNYAEFTQFIDSIKSLLSSHPEVFMKPDLSQVIYKIDELLTTFEIDPKQNRINNLVREIRPHDEEWKQKWFSYAKVQSEEVIRGLNSIKKVASSADDINYIIDGLERLTSKWPISESNISQFSKYLVQSREKLTNLNATPGVRQFLEQVANNKATIEDITPEVIEWLKENKFSSNIKISFK